MVVGLRLRRLFPGLAPLLGLLLLSPVVSCGGTTASEGSDGGGAGGRFGGNSGQLALGGFTGRGGSSGAPDAATSSAADAGACQQPALSWQPRTPTVFVLVDQSDSMFQCRTPGGALDATGRACADHGDTSWYPLRDGLLQVMSQLQTNAALQPGSAVRFGFSAYTGQMGDAVCPTLVPVLPALGNYAAIAATYNALVAPVKGANPTRRALDLVGKLLMADNAPGDKFILLVTDAQPDYCDAGDDLCPADSVVGGLQMLYAAKIPTFVFGVSSPLTTISAATLQAFANGGAGQPVLAPLDSGTTSAAFYAACQGVPDWAADLAATGKTSAAGQSVGNYAASGGTATLYKPDPANQQAFINQISSALAGVKSCVFDLGNQVMINLDLLSWAHVLIEGNQVPLNTGWQMNSSTQLQLIGDACATWRKPESTTIAFQFPCESIIAP